MTRRNVLAMVTLLLLSPAGVCALPRPDFSGTWKQSGDRCVPKRTGDVTLHIDHHGSDLIVEKTLVRSSGAPGHAVQRYTTDGQTSMSTGADGDEFHTSVVWRDQSLVLSIEEHEDGRVLLSRETWTLSEHGSALQIEREGPRKQTLIYLRESPKPGDQ